MALVTSWHGTRVHHGGQGGGQGCDGQQSWRHAESSKLGQRGVVYIDAEGRQRKRGHARASKQAGRRRNETGKQQESSCRGHFADYFKKGQLAVLMLSGTATGGVTCPHCWTSLGVARAFLSRVGDGFPWCYVATCREGAGGVIGLLSFASLLYKISYIVICTVLKKRI